MKLHRLAHIGCNIPMTHLAEPSIRLKDTTLSALLFRFLQRLPLRQDFTSFDTILSQWKFTRCIVICGPWLWTSHCGLCADDDGNHRLRRSSLIGGKILIILRPSGWNCVSEKYITRWINFNLLLICHSNYNFVMRWLNHCSMAYFIRLFRKRRCIVSSCEIKGEIIQHFWSKLFSFYATMYQIEHKNSSKLVQGFVFHAPIPASNTPANRSPCCNIVHGQNTEISTDSIHTLGTVVYQIMIGLLFLTWI